MVERLATITSINTGLPGHFFQPPIISPIINQSDCMSRYDSVIGSIYGIVLFFSRRGVKSRDCHDIPHPWGFRHSDVNLWCWWGGWLRTEKQNKLQAQLKVKYDAGNVATQPCKPRQAQTHCTETVQNDEKEPKNTQSKNRKTIKHEIRNPWSTQRQSSGRVSACTQVFPCAPEPRSRLSGHRPLPAGPSPKPSDGSVKPPAYLHPSLVLWIAPKASTNESRQIAGPSVPPSMRAWLVPPAKVR